MYKLSKIYPNVFNLLVILVSKATFWTYLHQEQSNQKLERRMFNCRPMPRVIYNNVSPYQNKCLIWNGFGKNDSFYYSFLYILKKRTFRLYGRSSKTCLSVLASNCDSSSVYFKLSTLKVNKLLTFIAVNFKTHSTRMLNNICFF